MRGWRAWTCTASIVTLVTVAWGIGTVSLPARAQISQQAPLAFSPPPPHLGYGINVRSQDKIDSLFAPLGFEWIKLWEEYEDDPPAEKLPYKVLFAIECNGMPESLAQWGDHVELIARAGLGFVEAYEIGNEPNVERFWGSVPPDPGQYVEVLKVAYERIKAVDPTAIVVSAGLAPVGRIEGDCNGWSGNNCDAMDEREYARQMFLLEAGNYLDAFGYHPYGFAYAPDTDPHSVPNGFAFRGVEVMHALLGQYGLGHKPVWGTEFNWLRDPSEDGTFSDWCHRYSVYEDNFGWMDVPEVQQANYITRAFQYADENWPWMGAMFVWNLDWHDYGWLCEPARYFSVLKIDYADYDPGEDPAPYITTLAYDALAAMEKRPGHFGPRLAVEPPGLSFLADVNEPSLHTGAVVPLNTGYGVFTWTATVAAGMQMTGTVGTGTVGVQVTPTLAITTGLQGTPLTVTIDSTGYSTGTFIGLIAVTATTTHVLDTPRIVPVMLYVVPEVYRLHLPITLRSAP